MATSKTTGRKVRTRKTPAKGLNDLAETKKPATRRTRTKSTSAATNANTIYANGGPSTRYSGFGNHQTAEYSIGGLQVLGVVDLVGKGGATPRAGKKERSRKDLKALFGTTMVGYWIKHDWLAEGREGFRITINGLNRISDRLNNPSDRYGADPANVRKMAAAIKSGKGEVGEWSPITIS